MAKYREALHKKLERLCEQIEPGDGLDPKYDSKSYKPQNRKALQLCAQVFETLSMAIPGFSNEYLQNSMVDSVLPNPDSSQLLVNIISDDEESEVLAALNSVSGRLRSEVANAITRKKTPKLRYVIRKKKNEE